MNHTSLAALLSHPPVRTTILKLDDGSACQIHELPIAVIDRIRSISKDDSGDDMANVIYVATWSLAGRKPTDTELTTAESIINDILRIAIQANITQPLLQGMGLVPGKATGGPVMRGQTYLVGEKGPELFTASNSGTITPNHKLGGNTQVNIYTQPGETAETRTRQTEQGDIIEVFMKQVDSRMNEQISRGQGLARTLEGRYALSRKSY